MAHPMDPWISNSTSANILIWLNRHRTPVLNRLFSLFLNCDIYCRLPERIFFPHPYGIVIHSRAVLGKDVVIGQQVTIGARNGIPESATIEDLVYIGAGAKILGKVHIGRGAMIGANAVVTKDVPAGATVVGANKIIKVRDKEDNSPA